MGIFSSFKGLIEQAKEYVNTTISIAKLEVARKASLIISNLIALLSSSVLFVLFVLFGSIAGALALSSWIGKSYAGFLIVAGFYMLIGIITWSNREKLIRRPILNSLIKEFFKEEDSEK